MSPIKSIVTYCLLTVLMAVTVHTFAFAPRHPSALSNRYLTLDMSTKERTKESLSTEDEEILFGEGNKAVSSVKGAKIPSFSETTLSRPSTVTKPSVRPLDVAKDPLVNRLYEMRASLQACPELWLELAQHCPDKLALLDERLCDVKRRLSFAQMSEMVRKSAAVFADFGVTRGVNVAILGENSAHWLIADHGIQLAGGASAVRGADAPLEELRYIYENSDSAGLVVLQGPKLMQKLAHDARDRNLSGLGLSNEKYGPVKTAILLNREKKTDLEIARMGAEVGVRAVALADLLDNTAPISDSRRPALTRSDLSTIVYTSGTTGKPKGVMLTHGNLIHQMGHRVAPTRPFEETEPLPGDSTVVLLPVWHITERMFELWMASRGSNIIYSSIRTFKMDLAKHRPQFMVLVPRVLEKIAAGVQDKFASGSFAVKLLANFFTKTSTLANQHKKIARGLVVADQPPNNAQKLAANAIVLALAPLNFIGDKLVWSKVQGGFGGRLKLIISGGSALPGVLETFYETAGLTICVGYGLTECSPIISFRRGDANLVTAGCAGKPCAETELRIVDPESTATDTLRPTLPVGKIGVVLAKGPQVMKGYYKNEEATAKAIDKFGFFNTGDLGRINPATGDLILTGRAKDTIVLSNGENIEPTPIEDAILGESPLIEQVMLIGQDGRRLVAIIVLSPRELQLAGFLSKDEADTLQNANEIANDPKCSPEVCEENCKILNRAAEKLRSNKELRVAMFSIVSRATATFRKWERVGDIYLTLEPFAMANGQLTQSYKVKRDAVSRRYEDCLPK